jgi:membrane-associated protein
MIFSIEEILGTFGYFALFSFVFAESGLFFGFFLPGDSLLFTSGILASKGLLDIYVIIVGTIICAFLGDQVGYWAGKRFGPSFFSKPKSFFRNPVHMEKAKKFYARHGRKAIVLARFVPVVRTFAPILAGTGRMDYRTFVAYNALGGIIWSTAFIGAGYLIGNILPNSGDVFTFIVLAIIVVSLIPVATEMYRDLKKTKKQSKDSLIQSLEDRQMKRYWLHIFFRLGWRPLAEQKQFS